MSQSRIAKTRDSTTNELLESVLVDINILQGWAEADAQHARESEDETSRCDAVCRFNRLVTIELMLKECKR